VTNRQGSKATISFHGNAIEIYGTVSANHGPFTLSLDGAPDISLSGEAHEFIPQTLLVCFFIRSSSGLSRSFYTQYCFSGLSNGPHTVILTHTSTNESYYTDLDHVVVYQWDKYISSVSSQSTASI
jgi:hypothetical protein